MALRWHLVSANHVDFWSWFVHSHDFTAKIKLTDAPHIVVRCFERLILFPLNVIVLLAGVVFLFEKAWTLGTLLVVVSVCIGAIGQYLPHRRKQTTRQLASGKDLGERFGEMTFEESKGFAKAVLWTSLLVGIIAGAGAIHRNLPMRWVVAYIVGSWISFPVLSVGFCFGWSFIMEKLYSHPA